MVEHDHSYRIMIVGVDNVLYHISGVGMGIVQDADLRSQMELPNFSSRWRLLRIDLNCQQV